MPADPVFWIAASAAVFLIGLSKGGLSGISLPGMMLLSLYMPPLQAAAMTLPIFIVQDAVSVWAYRKSFSIRALAILLPGAAIGMIGAALTASVVPQDAIRLAVGLIALSFAASHFLGLVGHAAKAAQPGKVPSGLFWGACAGFTSFAAHAGGPPFQVWMLPQKLDKLAYAGTSTLFFAAVNAAKIAPYFWLGQFSREGLSTAVALMPLAIGSALFGVWLVRRIDGALFYRVIYWLLLIMGMKLAYDGFTGLLG